MRRRKCSGDFERRGVLISFRHSINLLLLKICKNNVYFMRTESAKTADQSTTTNLVTEAVTSGTVPGSQAHSTNTSLQSSDPTEGL